jgi:sigma-E factor negative regulatory protein RseC
MKEIGCVASVSGDAAMVAMPMSGECKKCGLCKQAADGREVLLEARNDAGAREGDTVEIEIAAGRVLAAAFIIYMIPVLMTIVGFLVGSAAAGGDPEARLPIVLAVVFLVVSFVLVWQYDRRLRRTERRHAVVTRILSDEEAQEHVRSHPVAHIGG